MTTVKQDLVDIKQNMAVNHDTVMSRLDQMVGLMTKRDIELI